ncbi:polysaccharide biosynthesis/export family protein [Paraburkholderia atlantica]|uniref:polysaccharide biosynthesis/export family protein n=1 Tax=Paraburkholderia atlantica TaxID=2654982 RepID=UPI0006845AA4|nr:polysaccharide biosynthesis/export family protein [Paraburkholderia atlantica]MBB5509971.1 polysaccharide export outer membrane protein [Paraburkholderia atlantica]
MSRLSRRFVCTAVAFGAVWLGGCSSIPTSGPSRSQINDAGAIANPGGIQIVDVTDDVARKLFVERSVSDFSATLGNSTSFQQQLGVGDTIEVSIWEAPPATLFGASQIDSKGGTTNARVTVLPDQTIDGDGKINVPFAGELKAVGRTPAQLQRDIAARLKNIAHDPQVLVKLSRNATSYVTVVGDVASSNRMPLSARGERLLDALASAGGVKQPVDKITIQVTRGDTVASLPLETVIRDPRQNVPLHAGDVVTALFQPFSFTSLGATGKNQEINFEAQGITLAQALARAGGLEDSRSDAQGVFIFRLEDAKALPWPNTPVRTTADGKVPVVYRVNLRDPNSFFVAQSFMMDNKDLLYVSNAPIAEVQKFLNVVFSVAYPVITGVQTFR